VKDASFRMEGPPEEATRLTLHLMNPIVVYQINLETEGLAILENLMQKASC